MRRALPLLAILALTTLPGCRDSDSCGEDTRKAAVQRRVRDWYLYPDLLADVSPSAYGTAEEYLAALVDPAIQAELDRGWDFLLSEAEYEQHAHGQARDYGLSLFVELDEADLIAHVFVREVHAGSPAALAGFVRGDEILEIGRGTMYVLPGSSPYGISSLLYPGGVASTAGFQVLPRGGATPVLRTVVPAAYGIDPVPASWISGTTGYVQLRTFIEPAEDQLRAVFAEFQRQGVQDVVVDLRYNGGGLVQTAVLLANLLGGELAGRTMFALRFNARHASDDEVYAFSAEPGAGTFRRVAFLTTRLSASASELVPHVLDPYRTSSTIAYVGGSTYGKPVGQMVFPLGCDTLMFLVSFRIENSARDAGYFSGLPDASSHAPLCPADDDLTHDQDSPDEAMTRAAVYFVEHGECPPAPPAALRAPARRLIDVPRGGPADLPAALVRAKR